MFECLLHISYKLGIRKWRVSSDEDKAAVENVKLDIQQKFSNETGLLVDIVLQGKGTTNDGNTARKFFGDAETSARLTGIDLELIKRFGTLLGAINCGEPIDADRFEAYALQTFNLYTQLYPWYYLPAHTHKLLLHGATVIRHLLLPIGQLSEEAAEAANKIIRNFRRGFTRKDSLIHNLQDLYNRLMVSSDPFISTLRNTQTKKRADISAEVRQLLIENQNVSEENIITEEKTVSESEDDKERIDSDEEVQYSNSESEEGEVEYNDSEEEVEPDEVYEDDVFEDEIDLAEMEKVD